MSSAQPAGNLLQASASSDYDRSILWTFELPTLGAGETLTAADVSLAYRRDVSTGLELGSIFVLDSLRGTDTASNSDGIDPGNPPSTSGWTLLQDDFVDSSTSSEQNVGLDATGQTNLFTFLDNNYTAGEYLVISVAVDINDESTISDFQRFEFDDDRFTGAHYQLELTTIPEPSSLALLAEALGLAAVMLRRRRA